MSISYITTLFFATLVVSGNMVGVSLFVLPESLYMYGWYSWIGWVVCACCIVAIAIMFGDFATHYPNGGGPYEYTRHVYGNTVGRAVCVVQLVSVLIQNGSIAHVMREHFSQILDHLTSIDPATCAALCLYVPILVLTITNSRNFTTSGYTIIVLNTIKYTPILLLLVLGAEYYNYDKCFAVPHSNAGAIPAICGSVATALYAFCGIEFGVVPDVSEVRNPERIIPKALILGTLFATAVFTAMQALVWSVSNSASIHAHAGIPIPAIASLVFGESGQLIILCIASLFALTAMNTSLFIVSHLLSSLLSHNNHLDQNTHTLNQHNQTYKPTQTIWLSSALVFFVTYFLFSTLQGYSRLFNAIICFSDLLLALVFLVTAFAYRTLPISTPIKTYAAAFSSTLLALISAASLLAV